MGSGDNIGVETALAFIGLRRSLQLRAPGRGSHAHLAVTHRERVEHVTHLPMESSSDADVVVEQLPHGRNPSQVRKPG